MKLKFQLWLAALFAAVSAIINRIGGQPIALANELGLMQGGHENFTVDSTESFPVATRYLNYKRGAGGDNYAQIGDAASFPLGISPDAPYAAGDRFSVYRYGLVKHGLIGISAAAIALDDLILTAASGKVQGLTGVADGTYWIIGRCTKAVTAADKEVAFAPCTPIKVTTVGAAPTIAWG